MHLSSKIANKERKNASNIQDNASSCTSYHTCNILKNKKKTLHTFTFRSFIFTLHVFNVVRVLDTYTLRTIDNYWLLYKK